MASQAGGLAQRAAGQARRQDGSHAHCSHLQRKRVSLLFKMVEAVPEVLPPAAHLAAQETNVAVPAVLALDAGWSGSGGGQVGWMRKRACHGTG